MVEALGVAGDEAEEDLRVLATGSEGKGVVGGPKAGRGKAVVAIAWCKPSCGNDTDGCKWVSVGGVQLSGRRARRTTHGRILLIVQQEDPCASMYCDWNRQRRNVMLLDSATEESGIHESQYLEGCSGQRAGRGESRGSVGCDGGLLV